MFSAQEELDRLRPELRYLRVTVARLKRANSSLKNHLKELEKEYARLKREQNKLRQKNGRIEKEIEELKKTRDKLKKERDTYKGMIFKPHVSIKLTSGREGKKLGGQIGHKGFSRSLPARIDKELRVYLKSCPDCQTPLKRSETFEKHTVEDIPNFEVIKTVVTCYRKERQWCKTCKKEVVGSSAIVIPHSRLGLNLIIQILIFKYVCRMSLEVMVATIYQTYGVTVTEGGIVNILKRTKDWLGQKEYGKLLQAIRGSPIKHADETTWRIAGINGWLWAFVTNKEVYYTIEETRGGGVARKVLDGSNTEDVLIRDDYSAYKNLPLTQQSCWAHLLRKSKEEVSQKTCSKSVHGLHQLLKQLFRELEEVISEPFNLERRQKAYQHYSLKLNQIIQTKFRAKDAKRIQVRIKNQGNNLLTALLHPNVPLTNNMAERSIRPSVVIRKISGGSRSDIGAETFAVNMSVIQTIRMRNKPLIPTLHKILLKGVLGNTK